MGDRTFFRGKKTYDLDMLLRQSGEYFYTRKFGKIDSTILTTKQDIWNINASPDFTAITEYNFIETAGGVPLFAVCNNAAADQLIIITPLDTEGKQVEVPIILDGQNPVPLGGGAKYTRHQTSSLITLKSNPCPGDVYIYSGTATLGVPDDVTQIYGFILQGENRTQQGTFTIPTDCYGFFTDLHMYFVKKQAAVTVITLETSPPFGNNTPFDLTDWPSKQADKLLQGTISLTTVKPDARREFEQSPEIDPGIDLIFSQNADVAGAGIAVDFDIICIKKSNFGIASN